MSILQKVALILTVIGAINWGLIGLFGFDLIATIFNGGHQLGGLSRMIYTIVGISGLIALSALFRADEVYEDKRSRAPDINI